MFPRTHDLSHGPLRNWEFWWPRWARARPHRRPAATCPAGHARRIGQVGVHQPNDISHPKKTPKRSIARLQVLPQDRNHGVEPAAATYCHFREDASINLPPSARMRDRHPDLDCVLIEFRGDNLSRALSAPSWQIVTLLPWIGW